MNPEEFKKKWSPDKLSDWTEFNEKKLATSPLKEDTKSFLKNGFPTKGEPYLSFDMKFDNIYDNNSNPSLKLDDKTKNYWIFGSDGGNNPICFDTLNQDRLLILDHQKKFEIIGQLNVSVEELAHCLLFYKESIEKIQNKFGENAFFDSKYRTTDVDDLKQRFLSINPQIFEQSSFWNSSVRGLIEYKKTSKL